MTFGDIRMKVSNVVIRNCQNGSFSFMCDIETLLMNLDLTEIVGDTS